MLPDHNQMLTGLVRIGLNNLIFQNNSLTVVQLHIQTSHMGLKKAMNVLQKNNN